MTKILCVPKIFLQKETLCSHINFALSLRKGYTLLVHASNLGFLNNGMFMHVVFIDLLRDCVLEL